MAEVVVAEVVVVEEDVAVDVVDSFRLSKSHDLELDPTGVPKFSRQKQGF